MLLYIWNENGAVKKNKNIQNSKRHTKSFSTNQKKNNETYSFIYKNKKISIYNDLYYRLSSFLSHERIQREMGTAAGCRGLNAGTRLTLGVLTLSLACLLTCFARWSDLMNRRWQYSHLNFFSPVWVLLCLDNSSDRENRLPQSCHWQMNGFSPVWVLLWAFKCDDLK